MTNADSECIDCISSRGVAAVQAAHTRIKGVCKARSAYDNQDCRVVDAFTRKAQRRYSHPQAIGKVAIAGKSSYLNAFPAHIAPDAQGNVYSPLIKRMKEQKFSC